MSPHIPAVSQSWPQFGRPVKPAVSLLQELVRIFIHTSQVTTIIPTVVLIMCDFHKQ